MTGAVDGATGTGAPLVRRLFAGDRLIWWLLGVAAVMRLAAIADKGVLYDGNGFADAARYLEAARSFATTGLFSCEGSVRTAWLMPGMPVLLAPLMRLPVGLWARMFAVKVLLAGVSVACIYVLYVVGRRVGGARVGLLAASMLTLSLPHVYAGTIVLSENPYMLGLLLMTMLTIRLADAPRWTTFAWLVAAVCVTVYLKQAALGFLPPALVYLLVRRYPPRLLVRQAVVGLAVLVLALAPWWVRNYQVFGTFVPFTSFDGAPFFEGTFQRFQPYGTGSFDAMAELIDGKGLDEVHRSRVLVAAAWTRIAERWKSDPAGLVLTYGVMKPAAAWLLPFYWDKVFGIDGYWVLRLHALLMPLGLLLLAVCSVRSRSRAEFLLLALNALVITVGSAWYLGLSRYVYPYVPFVYVAVAYLVSSSLDRFAARAEADV